MTDTVYRRVLALDPGSRCIGFAVLENPLQLIDWGLKDARENKNSRCLEQVSKLVRFYRPSVIVVEDYSGKGSRRCPRIEKLLDEILAFAVNSGIPTKAFSRAKVRATFSHYQARTKHQITAVISNWFPELSPRKPPYRKCWMSPDPRERIFGAVALASTFYRTRKRKMARL